MLGTRRQRLPPKSPWKLPEPTLFHVHLRTFRPELGEGLCLWPSASLRSPGAGQGSAWARAALWQGLQRMGVWARRVQGPAIGDSAGRSWDQRPAQDGCLVDTWSGQSILQSGRPRRLRVSGCWSLEAQCTRWGHP